MLCNKGLKKTFIKLLVYIVHLQYRDTIMNQLNIHGFYNIFLFCNPNHFYAICTIIQNG